jgi:hypothetical protein
MNPGLQVAPGLLQPFGESGGASLTKEIRMNGALQRLQLISGEKKVSKYFDHSKLRLGLCRALSKNLPHLELDSLGFSKKASAGLVGRARILQGRNR